MIICLIFLVKNLKSNQEIAQKLNISQKCTRNYIFNLKRKAIKNNDFELMNAIEKRKKLQREILSALTWSKNENNILISSVLNEKTNKEIAFDLGISVTRVQAKVRKIKKSLQFEQSEFSEALKSRESKLGKIDWKNENKNEILLSLVEQKFDNKEISELLNIPINKIYHQLQNLKKSFQPSNDQLMKETKQNTNFHIHTTNFFETSSEAQCKKRKRNFDSTQNEDNNATYVSFEYRYLAVALGFNISEYPHPI